MAGPLAALSAMGPLARLGLLLVVAYAVLTVDIQAALETVFLDAINPF